MLIAQFEALHFLVLIYTCRLEKNDTTHAVLPKRLCSLRMERPQPQFAVGIFAVWSAAVQGHGTFHGTTALRGTR